MYYLLGLISSTMLEMGLWVFTYTQRGVCCSSYLDGLCQMPQVAGRVTIRLLLFFYTNQSIAIMESMAVKRATPQCNLNS